MSLRYAKTLLAGAAALALASGCGLIEGDDNTGPTSPPSGGQSSGAAPGNVGPTRPAALPVAGKATPQGQSDITANVNSFKADGMGFATLTYTLKNVGSADFQISGPFGSSGDRILSVQPGNVHVVDEQSKLIQETLTDTSRNCLCYWTAPGSDYFNLESGDEATFTNMYQISDAAQTVTVMLPGFQPVKGVKVERP